jgi:hypothetical protein
MVEVVPHEVAIRSPLLRAQLAFDVAVYVAPEALHYTLALVGPTGVRIDIAMIARVGPLEENDGTLSYTVVDGPLLLGVQPQGAADLPRVSAGIAVDAVVHGRGVHRSRRAYDHPLTRTGYAVTVSGAPCAEGGENNQEDRCPPCGKR